MLCGIALKLSFVLRGFALGVVDAGGVLVRCARGISLATAATACLFDVVFPIDLPTGLVGRAACGSVRSMRIALPSHRCLPWVCAGNR